MKNVELQYKEIPEGATQFQEVPKHFVLPEGITIPEPKMGTGKTEFALEGVEQEIDQEDVKQITSDFARDLEEVAPDLKSNSLAQRYSESFFAHLTRNGNTPKTDRELILNGMHEMYGVGRDVLGPLAVKFVHDTLKESEGSVVLPARDATPFFYIAKTLTTVNPDDYPVANSDIHNSVFNRSLWGIVDEQDNESEVLDVTHPIVQKLLKQMGFGSEKPVTFIEVGCWGSMVDQLNEAIELGKMDPHPYSVRFLYSHHPDNISGYVNEHGNGYPDDVFETIADTWEAFPKIISRPVQLVEDQGITKANAIEKKDKEGKMKSVIIDSQYMEAWQLAALQGVVDAAHTFAQNGKSIDAGTEIARLWELSQQAQDGTFTGVLPGHTETWSEGADWVAKWRWGKIHPLK